jgi:hypothetical protein
MINLVPAVVRKVIIKEYWVRVLSVFLLLSVLLSVLCILFALPVYVLISAQVDAYGASASAAAVRVAEFDISTGVLTKANVHAQKIIEQKAAAEFSGVLTQLEELAGGEVVLRGYEFTRKDGVLSPAVVVGSAATRQALADFHAALKAEPTIEKVDLPISNLAKEKDIEFTMTVTFKKTN